MRALQTRRAERSARDPFDLGGERVDQRPVSVVPRQLGEVVEHRAMLELFAMSS